MFGRLWRYLRALFGAKLDELEDPDILLQQAQEEMKEAQRQNRERAIQAITQKNNLQALVDQTRKTIDNLQAKAELALKNGDRDLARQLLVEKQQYDQTLASTTQSLESAQQSIDAIKTAIRREEERIRAKTAQALQLKAQWKQSQIEISINKALEGLTTDHADAAFERAQSKIGNARSESMARSELARESLNGRLATLGDVQANSAADAELAQLEQKLGMGTAPAATTSTPARAASPDEIDKQLAELEARVGTNGQSGGTGAA